MRHALREVLEASISPYHRSLFNDKLDSHIWCSRRFVAYEMPVATRISRVQVESGNGVEGFGAQLCLGLTNNETHSLTNLMRDVIAQESNH